MKKKIKIMTATYKNIRASGADDAKLRDFFADLDNTDSNLHNHTEEGVDIYSYPKIQYKVLGGHPVIVAAEEGIRSIHPHLMEKTEIRIGDEVYSDAALDISLSRQPIGDCKDIGFYEFATPWIALNQKNFARYEKADEEGKDEMLGNILTGNLLSLCKAFGVTIERKLEVNYQLHSITVLYKGRKMEGFVGRFQANCYIPDLLGIGKGTARGFGTVRHERATEMKR